MDDESADWKLSDRIAELKSEIASCVCGFNPPGAPNPDCERCGLVSEVARLKGWVNDLQSGMYVNCVYCGHRYGPREDTPVAMADVLKEHIEQCPEHPLSKALAEVARLKVENVTVRKEVELLKIGVRQLLEQREEARGAAKFFWFNRGMWENFLKREQLLSKWPWLGQATEPTGTTSPTDAELLSRVAWAKRCSSHPK